MSDYNLQSVPPGWRCLGEDEAAIAGDFFWNHSEDYEGERLGTFDIGHAGWVECMGFIGSTPAEIGMPIITKIKHAELPTPALSKEWLNPWE